jgi:acetolactate synthase-1/2/3 large subunit
MYRTATALLEVLHEAGVSYLFANFGSDHPPILESIAEARVTGRPMPAVITCPNEMVALSAAHGYAQVTGRGQAVLVHVDVGTQTLAGALHNASRCRVPVLIFSGAVPFTQQGELPGSRNEFIHWLQDVFDQRGIVRGYVKYDNEIRSGRNLKQIVRRAMQIAHSDPPGPVYLMATREVLEEEIPSIVADSAEWPAIAPCAMPASSVEALVGDLLTASRPLVVTSYAGRNPAAVEELVRLCRRLAIGVFESVPNYLNFPADNVLYQGSQWNEQRQHPVLAEADCILVIDSDIPWIPTVNRPASGARIHHIDLDPLKEKMPLWSIPAKNICRADAATALRQINDCLDTVHLDGPAIERRRAHYAALHAEREKVLRQREVKPSDVITPEFLTACVREHLDGETLVLNEAITSYNAVTEHLCATCPGTIFGSGASSLGWNGGAAIGMKLAHPEKTVVCLTGDGSYLFSVPATVHWIARRYQTPFLQIVYNNRGWRAPKLSALAAHPEGYVSRASDLDVGFDPPPDYAGIAAAAGGAFAQTVRDPGELDNALRSALKAVRKEGRCAVLDVWLAHL